MKARILLVAAALLGACQDSAPTAIDERVGSRAETLAGGPAGAAQARVAIDDALTRIVPTLSDQDGARAVTVALGRLRSELTASRTAHSGGRARETLQQLEEYGSRHPSDAAEVDAIRLAVAILARR